MSAKRSVQYLRSGMMAVLLLVGAGALWLNAQPEPTPRPKFCTTGLAFTTIDGVQMPLQDQGSPGRDGCDGSDRPRRSSVTRGIAKAPVVGYDCKARDVDGVVVATTQPNRPDGSCGQPQRRPGT